MSFFPRIILIAFVLTTAAFAQPAPAAPPAHK
jgi:hypothetical protein